jgi:hypothetical protein
MSTVAVVFITIGSAIGAALGFGLLPIGVALLCSIGSGGNAAAGYLMLGAVCIGAILAVIALIATSIVVGVVLSLSPACCLQILNRFYCSRM